MKPNPRTMTHGQLVAEVIELRAALALHEGDTDLCAIRDATGVTDHPARWLLALYQAKGRVLGLAAFERVCPAYGGWPRDSMCVMRSTVAKIRHAPALGPEAIEKVYGEGYRLTSLGRMATMRILASAEAA